MTRTPVLLQTPENAPFEGFQCLVSRRSEGVRKPYGVVRCAKQVIGIGSLAEFLHVTYREMGELLEPYVGKRYTKSAIGTWALVERRPRLSREWYHRYWMSDDVEQACKRLIRDAIHWLSNGRYVARVGGTHRWRVTLRRCGLRPSDGRRVA